MKSSAKDILVVFGMMAAVIGSVIWWNWEHPAPPPPTHEQIEARNAELKAKLAETLEKARARFAPGWYDIMGCVPFTSFDGSKLLMLNLDNTVKVATESGRWEFDKKSEVYTVTLGGVARTYSLVNQESVGLCVLAAGKATAANLQESWFSKIEDDYDDRDRDDYR